MAVKAISIDGYTWTFDIEGHIVEWRQGSEVLKIDGTVYSTRRHNKTYPAEQDEQWADEFTEDNNEK